MAGIFTNSVYTATIEGLMQATEDKIKNPYYKFTDKKPTEVTYFKQNLTKSTLDPTTNTHYQHIGEDSPLKFNMIEGFFLYGVERIQLDYDVTDYGLESSPITGDAIVLPNTIVPLDGDVFKINYIKEDVLFKVNKVTPDTLDNGSNIYKIEYQLEFVNMYDKLLEQVVNKFKFIIDYVGTEFSCFISQDSYNTASDLLVLQKQLITAFQIFFDPRLQTFVFTYKGAKMYDPYLIEFLIRNKVLSNADEYFFVCHATAMDHLFPYRYSKSFFSMVEDPTLFDLNKASKTVTAKKIEDINSLFYTRLEDFYKIEYFDEKAAFISRFNLLSPDLFINISQGNKFDESNSLYPFNPLISYFSGNTIDAEMMDYFRRADYIDCPEFFYSIPFTIFIIQKAMHSILTSTNTPEV